MPRITFKSKRSRAITISTAILLAVLSILFARSLPDPLFGKPYSTVLLDRKGQLLGAQVASDHQWRFPMGDSIPEYFSKAIICFEDRRFYGHPGVRPGSLARAMVQNIRQGRIVSGGSTLTMQVVRLWRDGKPRTIWEKGIEILLALRLELSYSKEEILRLYCAHAPFGGNVVGLEAASWRYFACSPHQLSLGECATLAVLPNSPGLIYPGRNQAALLNKRNRLLDHMVEERMIDSSTCITAKQEELPGQPRKLPSLAYHLLHRAMAEGHKGERLQSTIRLELQRKVEKAANRYSSTLSGNSISNLAVLVLDTRSGATLAYMGNVQPPPSPEDGELVDMTTAARSTGSILKPLLYAAMLSNGEILPDQLVADIPTFMGSFHPENFDRTYQGAVPASTALARSLNVPAVRMLQRHGTERFHSILRSLGMGNLRHSASHYGLSLILGGAEGSLWEISGMYAGMARQLIHFCENSGTYLSKGYYSPYYLQHQTPGNSGSADYSLPDASSIWFTFRALARVNRPFEESHWRQFSSTVPISWKTGTSFGFRDAWAIAVTPEYTVGVWVGNATGEGRPGLTGLRAAAPLLFDILNQVNPKIWFPKPYDDFEAVPTCRNSGFKAGPFCEIADTLQGPRNGNRSETCPYHTQIYLDARSGKRVSNQCRPLNALLPTSWFVLPPEIEHYYKQGHPLYRPLPPFLPGCAPAELGEQVLAILYPKKDAQIFVAAPEASATRVNVVFEATHRDPDALIYWFIDEQYYTTTRQFHKLEALPESGEHILTIIDMDGNSASCRFSITRPQ